MESNSETSNAMPLPVRSRLNSAISTPLTMYMPVAVSTTAMPHFAGCSCVPLIDRNPASHCTSRS